MPDGIQQLNEDIIGGGQDSEPGRPGTGFGHVSARIPDSDLFVITPRVSLELVEANQLVVLNLQGQVLEAPVSPSFETALHTAIFNARPEVNAITESTRGRPLLFGDRHALEAVHNHGSFFSGGVPVHRAIDLISTRELGEGAAAALGDAAAVLLQGNGQVTVGRTIPEAVMMAIYLEEAAQILYGAMQVGTQRFLPGQRPARGKRGAAAPGHGTCLELLQEPGGNVVTPAVANPNRPENSRMITIGEEMLLLMLDYDTGWYNTRLPPHSRRNAISGALLMDLALENRIDTDPQGPLRRRPRAEPGHPQAHVLARIVEERNPGPSPTGSGVRPGPPGAARAAH